MSDHNIRNAHPKCILEAALLNKKNYENHEKIRIPIPKEAQWEGITGEWVWVEKVDVNTYALRNIPIYAYGLSFDDRFHLKNCEGILELDDLVAPGGHSTYRIISSEEISKGHLKAILETLTDLGCDTEIANQRHVAIDVPPETDIDAVIKILLNAEESGALEFEEGHRGHDPRPSM